MELDDLNPDVMLKVTTDESLLALVEERFDAGTRLGEFIERDMISRLPSTRRRSGP
jgi:hypothetical protein